MKFIKVVLKPFASVLLAALFTLQLAVGSAMANDYSCDLASTSICNETLSSAESMTVLYANEQSFNLSMRNIGQIEASVILSRFKTYPEINGNYGISPGDTVPYNDLLAYSDGSGSIVNATTGGNAPVEILVTAN
ncbi:MAG: hypothetical protein F6K21_31355 [Symploca sp. SIO2D2]|nr:hypothetical protein [Symploca sp. SIO2D2]